MRYHPVYNLNVYQTYAVHDEIVLNKYVNGGKETHLSLKQFGFYYYKFCKKKIKTTMLKLKLNTDFLNLIFNRLRIEEGLMNCKRLFWLKIEK